MREMETNEENRSNWGKETSVYWKLEMESYKGNMQVHKSNVVGIHGKRNRVLPLPLALRSSHKAWLVKTYPQEANGLNISHPYTLHLKQPILTYTHENLSASYK